MTPQDRVGSAIPRAKRKSLADNMAARQKSAFKAELNASFNFRWPVLNEVDSGVVLLKLQDDPSIRALASRARQRSEATAAARTEARKRRKLIATPDCEGLPSQETAANLASLRKNDRRSRAEERREQAQRDEGLPIVGLSAVGRALERGQLAAVVICRDALLCSGSPSAASATGSRRREASSATTAITRMVAHIPALCHRYGTALCCLGRNVDTVQLGRTIGQRRCVAIGIARATDVEEAVASENEQRESYELYEWLQKRCPAPDIGWLPSIADRG